MRNPVLVPESKACEIMAARKEIDMNLVRQLREEGMTVANVAKQLGVCRSTLETHMRESGLSTNYNPQSMEELPWNLDRWRKAMMWLR